MQTNLLDGLHTRLAVQVFPLANAPRPAGLPNPVLDLGSQLFSLQTHLMDSIPSRLLGRPVDNLLRHCDRIIAAVGMIFNGF